MNSSIQKITLLLSLLLLIVLPLKAQNDNNPILFSNQAILLGDQRQVNDPVTMILPGTALASGFGSFLDNPAAAALFDESFVEIGVAFRRVDEDSRFLGNTQNLTDEQTTVSNAGFVYKIPTKRGSFVLGGGFNQQEFFNRALSVSGRNPNATITDQFKIPGNTFEDIAFNTFAVDYGDEEQTFLESIFRIGSEFPGIRQEAEITNRGYAGEFAGYFGMEFQKNFFIGASLGATSAAFKFNRTFLEIDEFNDFSSSFIDSDGDGEGDTDIDSVLLSDAVRSDMTGFRARIGAIYKLAPWLNIGGSYTFRSRLNVDETFDARILTTMDNGMEFEDEVFGEFSYRISFPARVAAGIAFDNLAGFFTASASAEYVQFSKTRINFRDDALFEEQREENRFISETFDDVWSYRGGVAFAFHEVFTLRGGYGYQPSRFKDGRDKREMFSGGFGIGFSDNAEFDVGAQLTTFDETSTVFDFQDADENIRSETANRDVDRIQVIGTLRIKF